MKKIFNNIFNNVLDNVYFGPQYLVEDIKKDEDLKNDYDQLFKRAFYMEHKKMLLIYLGNFLYYKLNQYQFINLSTKETINIKQMRNEHNYIIKDTLLPYSDFKKVKIKDKTLADIYPKKKVLKILRNYFVEQNKNKNKTKIK